MYLSLNRRVLTTHYLIESTPFAFDVINMQPLSWELESAFNKKLSVAVTEDLIKFINLLC